MNVVVTGSNGFIGKKLVTLLLKKEFNVRCIDFVHGDKNPNAEYFDIDLADKEILIASGVLKDADYVFHLAGVTKRTSLDEFRLGNVTPTENIINILEKQEKLKRFVFISSQAAAGPAVSYHRPVTKDTPPRPVEAYGMSKLEAEYFIRFQSTLPFTIIRPCSVYGPGDVDFLPIFKQIHSHLALYPNNKNNFVSTIFVDDLINGIYKAAISEKAIGRVYFLGSEKPVNWRDIYRTIAHIQAKKVLEISIPKTLISLAAQLGEIYTKLTGRHTLLNRQKIALSKPQYWICSSQSAWHDFGFAPQYSLQEGLSQTSRFINI